jgi:hypothetical protein
MSSRERDQADLDLDTFIELFDEAISSNDPRVQRALQDLLVISALIRTKSDHDQVTKGPLRRLFDDVNNINRRLNKIEHADIYEKMLNQMNQKPSWDLDQYSMPITVTPNTMPPYPYGTWNTKLNQPSLFGGNLADDPNIKPYMDSLNPPATSGEDC